MAYTVPRVLISQEFTQVPVFGDQPLSALVFGPQYNLFRFNNTSEKPSTAVTHPDSPELTNEYQRLVDTTYDFPNQEAGTFVDSDFVKVYIDKAQLEYFPNDISDPSGYVVPVVHPTSGANYTNRFQGDELVFKTGNGTDRTDVFCNRDVAVGDVIILTNEADSSDTATVRVKALHAIKSAAAVGTPSNDTDNKATASQDYNNALTWAGSGSAPAHAPANSSAAYIGYNALGIVSDVYTVEVTAVGATLADARFKISSASGAFADKVDQSLDGSDVLVIDDTDSNDIKIDYTGATAPVVGDKWTLNVTAAVTRLAGGSTITAATPYRGAEDIVYKLVVSRGGPFYNGTNADVCAKISVFSDKLDSSSDVKVTSGTAFKVGSYGVTATISGATANGGLIYGDVYYIAATAAADQAYGIIETYETLPATFISGSDDWDITSMRLVDTISVPNLVDAYDDVTNWDVDSVAQTITIKGGITSTNSKLVTGSELLSLDVVSGKVYVEHRDLVVTNSLAIGSVQSTDEVEAILGPIDPDNPLAQAVYHAALNAGGVPVYFAAVGSNDLDGYLGVLDLAEKADTYYGLVPLTSDVAVRDAVTGHVNAQSTPELAKWRVAWLTVPVAETEIVYDKDSSVNDWRATITDYTFASGTQYKLVTVSGASFITDGIRPTDRVLINFRTDANGATTYDSYAVAEVRTETTLVLATALASAVNVAVKMQIQRVYTKDEQADKLSLVGGEYNNRRVRVVFPSVAKSGSVSYAGYVVAAALAGLRSSVVPHQGLTNTQVLGFDNVSTNRFTETQLNRIAAQGIWIVTQATTGATPYVRHQLTTDESSLNTSEDSITTNVDSISYGLMRALSPYIGIYNVHPRALVVIRAAIDAELTFRATGTFTIRAGNQLNSYKIVSLAQNATFKDRVDAEIDLDVPYPLNKINIKLVV